MQEKISVVTGARGYVGYALVNELAARGAKIRLYLRHDSHELDHFGCEKVFGDISEPENLRAAFAGADTVYHVAGLIDITGTKDALVWKVNYEGTKNVVDACKAAGVKNLVFVSSVDAVPALSGHTLMTEPARFDPDAVPDAYAKSKAAASQYVIDASDDKLKTCVVMPSCCIGPDDIYGKNSVCTMIRLYDRGLFPCSLSFGAYNFIDVRDVAKGMIAAAEVGKGGECFFLSGERMTIDRFISTLAKINGRRPPRIRLSKRFLLTMLPLIRLLFRILKIPPILTAFSIEKICENCHFSNEKARRELGVAPMTATESLTDTVAWLKANPIDKDKETKKKK